MPRTCGSTVVWLWSCPLPWPSEKHGSLGPACHCEVAPLGGGCGAVLPSLSTSTCPLLLHSALCTRSGGSCSSHGRPPAPLGTGRLPSWESQSLGGAVGDTTGRGLWGLAWGSAGHLLAQSCGPTLWLAARVPVPQSLLCGMECFHGALSLLHWHIQGGSGIRPRPSVCALYDSGPLHTVTLPHLSLPLWSQDPHGASATFLSETPDFCKRSR